MTKTKTVARKTLALILSGDRKWEKINPIRRELQKLMKEYDVLIVIHGAAPGADTVGALVADNLMIPIDPVPAEWEKFGPGAGPIRNGRMLNKLLKFKADKKMVLAFHPDLTKSKGTKDMVKQARNAGVEAKVINK